MTTTLEIISPREREVLALIGMGLSSNDIAKKLCRSLKTVESHRLKLGKKLGMKNRVQLARIAIVAGLTDLRVVEATAAGDDTTKGTP